MLGLHQGYLDIQAMPTSERKWFVDRYIEQKKKEYEEYSKASAAAKTKSRSRR
jgi:hypothetical protein